MHFQRNKARFFTCRSKNTQGTYWRRWTLWSKGVSWKNGGWWSPHKGINVFQGELKKVGVKNIGAIATPTIRNERAFLITTVGVTSVLAVAAGQLPGDWVSPAIIESTVLWNWATAYRIYYNITTWSANLIQEICDALTCVCRWYVVLCAPSKCRVVDTGHKWRVVLAQILIGMTTTMPASFCSKPISPWFICCLMHLCTR